MGGKSTFPHSPDDNQRTRSGRDGILATANFAVHRMRNETVDTYVGRYDYKLARFGTELKIRERRAILDNEALRPQGKISFIL
jgi:3-phenylpropionate/cinnamic acid dioxygenase small subunit